MSVLAIPMVSKYPVRRKITVVLTGTISVLIASLWYFYWVPYLVDTYQFKLYFPKGLIEGLNEILQYPFDTMDKFWFTSFYSFIAFAIFIVGFVLMIVKKNKLLISVFAIVSVVFIVFILKTGSVFSLHNYYIIPYTPIMALIAGFGLSFIKIKWQIIVLVLITFESLANQSYDFLIKDSERYKLELESAIENKVNKHDLIIVNGAPSPQTMYFLHSKGWNVENEQLFKDDFIEQRINKGAKYLIIDKHRLNKSFSFPVIYQDENIDVYQLK